MSDQRAGSSGSPTGDNLGVGRPDAAAAVAQTLRELGLQLDQWAVAGEVPPGASPFAGSAFGAGVADGAENALLASLGIDAVIDTNATVSQRSLHDFLR